MSSAQAPDIRAAFDTNLKEKWIQRPRCDDPDHESLSKCPCRLPIFYHTPELKKWMMQKDYGEKTNVELLMNSQKFASPPGIVDYTPKLLIEDNHDQCILLFSCLLKRNEGRWLYFFRKAGYADSNLRELGSDLKKRRDKLEMDLRRSGEKPESIKSIIAIFDEEKWAFCPVEFNDERKLLSGEFSFHNGCILPFCARGKVKQGGTAFVSPVVVREEFISESIRKRLGEPHQDKEFGKCYDFAIKSYDARSQAETFFNERQAFSGLMDVDGVVRFFGSYSSTDGEAEYHNIILELGRMDLFESYLENDPPQRPKEIITNWKSITNVAKAIRYIHKIQRPSGNSFYGIHGDVKPDNILLVGNELKLADFGFAFFVKDEKSGINAPDKLLGRTRSYGAPERNPSDKIDIWSFGCVLSVNATWIVAGYAGVEDFVELRYQSNEVSKDRKFEHNKFDDPTDAFHDGTSVLEQISKWHGYLKTIVRKSDTITPRILDVIEEVLFQKEPDMRADSKELCKILENIIQDEEEKLEKAKLAGPEIDDDVAKALFAGELRRRRLSSSDQEAKSKHVIQVNGPSGTLLRTSAVFSSLLPPQSGKARKLPPPRPGISQRETTLASSLQVDRIEVLPKTESGTSSNEAEASTYQVLELPKLSVTGPNGSAANSPGVSIQNHVIDQNTKGKGKQVASPEQDDPPESSRHQQLSAATLPESHTPTIPRLPDEQPMSTITAMPASPIQSHPGSDAIIEEPESTGSNSEPPDADLTRLISQRDSQGRTPAMQAATLGEIKTVQTWLGHWSFNPKDKDKAGKNVLHHLVSWAAGRTNMSQELSTLISDIERKDATLFNAFDAHGRSPLYLSRGNFGLLDILIQSSARVDKLSFNRAIELDLVAGTSNLVEYYRKHGAKDDWIEERLKSRIRSSKTLKHILPKQSQKSKLFGRKDK